MPHEFREDTLDDIKNRDILNLETILKKKGRMSKVFGSSAEAYTFIGIRMNAILENVGISPRRGHSDKEYDIDLDMKQKNVKVENRPYEEPGDEWRSGFYIYKNNEIAGFIGLPIFSKDDNPIVFRVLCTEKI